VDVAGRVVFEVRVVGEVKISGERESSEVAEK